MKIQWSRQARKTLDSYDNDTAATIVQKADELATSFPHPDAKPIEDPEHGTVFRLTIKPGTRQKKGEGVDHRLLFDIRDGIIRILDLFHRDTD